MKCQWGIMSGERYAECGKPAHHLTTIGTVKTHRISKLPTCNAHFVELKKEFGQSNYWKIQGHECPRGKSR